MASNHSFPILDFSSFTCSREAFIQEVFQASHDWGFFVLTNAGLDNVERIFELSQQFFELPFEQKAERLVSEQAVGYDGQNMTTFAASEGIQFGLPAGRILQTDNLPSWWNQSRREEIEDFKSQCYELSTKLLSCFAVALGLDEELFRKHHLHTEPGNNLKLIKYPQMEQQANGIPRLSEHTDWGTMTFVFSKQGGLEIRDPKDEWCQVPVVEGGIVVNIGDALALWTGKALKSTLHRITWENLRKDQDRYSIAYFVNPNYDAPLRTPQADVNSTQPSLTYRDFYKIRLRLTYGGIKDLQSAERNFEDIDSEQLEMVRKLGVANHGKLASNHLLEV